MCKCKESPFWRIIYQTVSVSFIVVGAIGCILCDLALYEIDPISVFINGVCFVLAGVIFLILAFAVSPTNPKQETPYKKEDEANRLNEPNATYPAPNLLKKRKKHIRFISDIVTRINSLKCKPTKYCSYDPNKKDNKRENPKQHDQPPINKP